MNKEKKEIYKRDIGNNELYRLKIIDESKKCFTRTTGGEIIKEYLRNIRCSSW